MYCLYDYPFVQHSSLSIMELLVLGLLFSGFIDVCGKSWAESLICSAIYRA
jgi:membrane protein CcdC involved in cytochrome C biogenesis